MASGVAVTRIVLRQTALTLSAAPATTRHPIATARLVVSPARVTATPDAAIAATTIRPSRRMWLSHPVENAETVAPNESAA